MRPIPIVPGVGQESVWDYPRPPRIEATPRRIRVELAGVILVDTTRAVRVLETSHPPVYYVPIEDVIAGALTPTARTSFCEWKGAAHYFDVTSGDRTELDAAWG